MKTAERTAFGALPYPKERGVLWGRHAVEGAGVFDLEIVAAMLPNGVQRIYTFDHGDFRVFAELTVARPT